MRSADSAKTCTDGWTAHHHLRVLETPVGSASMKTLTSNQLLHLGFASSEVISQSHLLCACDDMMYNGDEFTVSLNQRYLDWHAPVVHLMSARSWTFSWIERAGTRVYGRPSQCLFIARNFNSDKVIRSLLENCQAMNFMKWLDSIRKSGALALMANISSFVPLVSLAKADRCIGIQVAYSRGPVAGFCFD